MTKYDLGRSLIRYQNSKSRNKQSDLKTDGIKNKQEDVLKSVVVQTSLEEFFDLKDLCNESTDINMSIINNDVENDLTIPLSSGIELSLSIPKRPKWDGKVAAIDFKKIESESFVNWRREISLFCAEKNIVVTPYEKNLDIWRQFWRVVELCDIICQIVDARNPLFFYSNSIEEYAQEIDPSKVNILLINKSDFLTEIQREEWLRYFLSKGKKVYFFSAVDNCNNKFDESEHHNDNDVYEPKEYHIISRNDFINAIDEIRINTLHKEVARIGFVGFPNVGKSSTINKLLELKRVATSMTPGKTKHFQTHELNQSIILCDCPGLVLPNLVRTQAELVINGILPIDQLKDFSSPVRLILSYVPQNYLENVYNVSIPITQDREPSRLSFCLLEEFLNTLALARGFMTTSGLPDVKRTARQVLKDFVSGKILFCYPPSDNWNPSSFNAIYEKQNDSKRNLKLERESAKFCESKTKQEIISKLDDGFFETVLIIFHIL